MKICSQMFQLDTLRLSYKVKISGAMILAVFGLLFYYYYYYLFFENPVTYNKDNKEFLKLLAHNNDI